MKYIIQLITLITLVCSANIAIARGGKPPPAPEPGLLNVVTVSPQYGDYTSPVEAINSITNANAENRYLLVVGPGVYEVSTALVMKEWVTIQGAGQESTVITGAISSESADETSAIVKGQNNAAITDLSIENRGGNVFSIAIFNSDASPRIERVTAEAFGAYQYATGILNEIDSSPVMTNVSASGLGTTSTTQNYGVYNVSGSSPTMVNVNANASGAAGANPGIFIGGAAPFIIDSVLDGTPGLALEADYSDSRIVNNKIIGGVGSAWLAVTPTAGSVCRGNYDENLVDVNCPTP